MVAGVFAGNISAEATTPTGNTFVEAMRGEYTPACAALLESMISSAFPVDLIYIAVGGLDLARAFAAPPWNHLLYTGSARIGKPITEAACRNLTPVTLELGGKCPGC